MADSRGQVIAMNVEMEHRAERLGQLFPPPQYRVELIAHETMMWVVGEETGAVATVGEHDFEFDPEGEEEIDYIRRTLS